jgi:hypothetical protein
MQTVIGARVQIGNVRGEADVDEFADPVAIRTISERFIKILASACQGGWRQPKNRGLNIEPRRVRRTIQEGLE